jgi:hypothetical protein
VGRHRPDGLGCGAHVTRGFSVTSITRMVVLAYVVVFLALWAGLTLILSGLPWFRQRRPLSDRLAPYCDRSWVDDIEAWLDSR